MMSASRTLHEIAVTYQRDQDTKEGNFIAAQQKLPWMEADLARADLAAPSFAKTRFQADHFQIQRESATRNSSLARSG